jgi:hypothetical protein
LRLVFGRDQLPSTWGDMVEAEVTNTRRALDAIESLDPAGVPHGDLLAVLVECRTLSKSVDVVRQKHPQQREQKLA